MIKPRATSATQSCCIETGSEHNVHSETQTQLVQWLQPIPLGNATVMLL